MKVSQSLKALTDNSGRLSFCERLVCIGLNLTTFEKFGDQVQILVVQIDLVEFDNIRVICGK